MEKNRKEQNGKNIKGRYATKTINAYTTMLKNGKTVIYKTIDAIQKKKASDETAIIY